MTATIRDALRARTAPAHARLDALWSLEALAERDTYTSFLQAQAAALIPLEAQLEAAGAAHVLDDWPARRRTNAIEADLAGLGATAPRLPPTCLSAPALSGEAALLGALYVLEGSRLGGALIARHAARSTDPAVLANRRYIRHGEGLPLWRFYLQRLEAVPPEQTEPLAASALSVFELFESAARLTRA